MYSTLGRDYYNENYGLRIGDKVMFIDDYSEWYVLALYPSIEHLVCITTDETRKR